MIKYYSIHEEERNGTKKIKMSKGETRSLARCTNSQKGI